MMLLLLHGGLDGDGQQKVAGQQLKVERLAAELELGYGEHQHVVGELDDDAVSLLLDLGDRLANGPRQRAARGHWLEERHARRAERVGVLVGLAEEALHASL